MAAACDSPQCMYMDDRALRYRMAAENVARAAPLDDSDARRRCLLFAEQLARRAANLEFSKPQQVIQARQG
jgi:hypothetical protein